MHRRRRWTQGLAAIVAVATATTAMIGCSDDEAADAPRPPGPTSTAPPTVSQPADAGEPGTLIDAQRVTDAPPGMRAWRITYASRTAAGDPVAVTGQIIVPEGEPPPGGWPVVGWGHPTAGTSDLCAPTVRGPTAIHNLSELTAAGIAIAATDYEGLGTQGSHPYLVGAAEGHDVLDAVRAGAALEDSGITRDSPVVLSGFSQGGHAALWAAQLAPTYAPELDIVGVQAVSPVSDVPAFAERAEGLDEQFGVLVTIAYGMAQAYPELDLDEVLTPEALDLLPALEEQCIGDVVITYTRPVADLLRASPRSLPGWRDRLAENTAGQVALGLPVHILQGADDPIVYEKVTRELVGRLCAAGDDVQYDVIPDVDHAVLTPERTVPWIEARFAGDPATGNCPSPN
jgi:alpha-beta hydrolase superfamily lysophospholipase